MQTTTLALVAALAGAASGATFQWNWTPSIATPANNQGLSNSAGNFESLSARFNSLTDQLDFSVTFSNQVTQGLTLALNNGPNPKGHGELALLYIDATQASNVRLTAYGYNGQNNFTSYRDGLPPGTNPPDRILGLNDNWVNSASLTDANGKRTIAFSIDASAINNRSPLYPQNGVAWTGIGFDALAGIWLHTYAGLSTSYDSNGFLTANNSGWNRRTEGYFDGNNFTTTPVANVVPLPAPVWAGLAGLAGVAVIARKRKA